jgi:hypothetical protein
VKGSWGIGVVVLQEARPPLTPRPRRELRIDEAVKKPFDAWKSNYCPPRVRADLLDGGWTVSGRRGSRSGDSGADPNAAGSLSLALTRRQTAFQPGQLGSAPRRATGGDSDRIAPRPMMASSARRWPKIWRLGDCLSAAMSS